MSHYRISIEVPTDEYELLFDDICVTDESLPQVNICIEQEYCEISHVSEKHQVLIIKRDL